MALKPEEAGAADEGAPVLTSNLAMERAIVALIYRAARLSDEQRYLDWMELFTADGEYSAITNENLAYKGLRLFRDMGRNALHERAAFLMGLLQVPRGKTLHLVSNIEVSDGERPGTASAASHFIMTRTADMEHSMLHAAGRYLDRFEQRDGVWLFKERLVVVDSNLLPPEFTELL
jgi:3-phenylpropionate/cinnamic acid dioxygenase small subunit